MKNFPDPILTEMSKRLRNVRFEPDTVLDHAAETISPLRGVRLFPENKKRPDAPRDYAVVIFVAQKERIIGKTRSLTTACRFADMAKMKFFKYRQRHAVEPSDDDLNFSVAQAKSDLQFETDAVELLNNIEIHFREKGFWTDKPAKETRRSDIKSERWTIARAVRALEARMQYLEEIVESFKHYALPVDTCVNHVKTEAVNFEANKKMVPFTVHVPDPADRTKVHHSVTIHVEARIENGEEILTTKALEIIAQTHSLEFELLKSQQINRCAQLANETKQTLDPIAELIP